MRPIAPTLSPLGLLLALALLGVGCEAADSGTVIEPDATSDTGAIGDATEDGTTPSDTLPGDTVQPDATADTTPDPDVPPAEDIAIDVIATACGGELDVACPPNSFCATPAGQCGGQGECKPLPGGCPEYYQPVCGCDGKTYGNSCDAAASGQSVAKQGACDAEPVKCLVGDMEFCGKSAYCEGPEGQCGGPGVCKPRPMGCDAMYAPVCGCDGKTYGNACEAAATGVSVSAQGECGGGGKQCFGGMAKGLMPIAPCPGGEFCATPDGQCGGQGTCKVIPVVCTKELNQVCGCDGKTYANPCFAQAAGANVAASGECKPAPSGCKVGDNSACAVGEFCSGPCGGEGACAPKAQACPMIYDPVCGCDGKTYGNGCSASAEGVAVASKGACTDPQPVAKWYYTCGDPVCSGWKAHDGVALCTKAQQPGDPCATSGEMCDPMDGCNRLLRCTTDDPALQPGGCPK